MKLNLWLEYNETLQSDIPGLKCYHFACAQDNCDALLENKALRKVLTSTSK